MTEIVEEILKERGFNTLKHYGVLGMRWGHRKTAPISTRSGKTGSIDPQLASVGILAAAYAAYGAYHLIDSKAHHQFKTRNTPFKTNTKLASKNMSVKQLHDTVVKPINPDFGKRGTKMNCRRCTFAYEMRRRGLDVKATTSTLAAGQTTKGLIRAINPRDSPISEHHVNMLLKSDWGETPIGDHSFSSKNALQKSDQIFKNLNSMPSGARGELTVGWKFGGGHSMAWENVKGKTVVFDTQSGKTYESSFSMANHIGNNIHEAALTRLDNKDLNSQFLRRWVTNVE